MKAIVTVNKKGASMTEPNAWRDFRRCVTGLTPSVGAMQELTEEAFLFHLSTGTGEFASIVACAQSLRLPYHVFYSSEPFVEYSYLPKP